MELNWKTLRDHVLHVKLQTESFSKESKILVKRITLRYFFATKKGKNTEFVTQAS